MYIFLPPVSIPSTLLYFYFSVLEIRSDRTVRACFWFIYYIYFFPFHVRKCWRAIPFDPRRKRGSGGQREKPRVRVCVFHHPITPFFTCQPNEANIKQLTARDCLTLFYFSYVTGKQHVMYQTFLFFFFQPSAGQQKRQTIRFFFKKKKKNVIKDDWRWTMKIIWLRRGVSLSHHADFFFFFFLKGPRERKWSWPRCAIVTTANGQFGRPCDHSSSLHFLLFLKKK